MGHNTILLERGNRLRLAPLLKQFPIGLQFGHMQLSPCLDEAWFHPQPGGITFMATLKIGYQAWGDRGDLATMKRMIESVAFWSP